MDTDINNCLFSNVNRPLTSSSSRHNYRQKNIMETSSTSTSHRPCSCSECGKNFRSWKALFGHMRCHPERQWRGINPPPNFRRRSPVRPEGEVTMTEEDLEVAACLLMLANSCPDIEQSPLSACNVVNQGIIFPSDSAAPNVVNKEASSGFSPSRVSCGNNMDLNGPPAADHPVPILLVEDAAAGSSSSLELRLGL